MILTTPFHIDGLTASAYHAAPGISSTMIRCLPEDPLTFRNRYMCRRPHCMKLLEDCRCNSPNKGPLTCQQFPLCDPHKVTPQMQLGFDVHRVLLDGADIRVIPSKLLTKGGNRPTGKNELPLLEWEAEHRDAVHVLTEDSPVHRMTAAVRFHDDAFDMLYHKSTVRERSIWWVDDATGLLCKARIDLWHDDDDELLDLKTTKSPRPGPRDFKREIDDYELHRQLAHYTAGGLSVGMVARKSGIIAVGNSPEYECWPHPMSAEAMSLGWEQNIRARRELVVRLESGDWYPEGYGEATETGPSQWYMDRHGA